MITGVALAAATSAFAADAAATNENTVGELVVTGSRIPQPNLTSVSPVTAVNNQEIKLQGTTKVEDLINNLPQAFSDQGGTISNGGVGTATVNLRNLGPSRTLVLIDGRRVVPGDPAYPYADLNFIPASLVDRVEVDTGGASAVYGSDAVAGVVNFIMKRNFEGVQIDSNFTFNSHHNGNKVAQDAITRKGFILPDADVADGKTWDVNITTGVNSPDGKGNITGYFGYRHTDPLLQSQRDYSACGLALNKAKTQYNCSGSATTPHGTFFIENDTNSTIAGGSVTLDEAHPTQFRAWNSVTDVYNFNPTNYFQRPDERYSAGFFAHYEVHPKIDVYSEFMFMDDHTVAQIAASGIFGQTFAIACNNPFLSAQEVTQMCTNQGKGPTDRVNVAILRRNVEGGPRQDDLRHTDYRMVFGARGDIDPNWHYDLYGSYSTAIYNEEYLNDVSLKNTANAIDAVPGPGGTAVCASGAPGCVPYNIWSIGGVTPGAINYISVPGFKRGQTTEQVVSGVVTGKLGDYGLKSPAASEGVGIAVGAEYRREALVLHVDQEFATGDLAGQGGPTQPIECGPNKGECSFDVKELFGEVRVPLVQDMAFAKELSFEAGYRYSNYHAGNHNFSTNTYKLGGNWSITPDVRLRASYQRAVRAPNVVELFNPQVIGLDFNSDPCAGAVGNNGLVSSGYTVAQCANTGVSAAQYGHVPKNPAAQYNGLIGGNPNLQPEKSDTYSVGAVFTPSFVPGFNASIDYYHIKVNNVIQGFGSQNIINTCGKTGDAFICSLIHRAPGNGNLWLGTVGYVENITRNSGFLETAGIDFNANYRLPLGNVGWENGGSLAFQFQASWTDYYKLQQVGAFPLIDCVGKYGQTCQGTGTPMTAPTPTWRHKLRTTWTTPLDGLDVSLDWRHISGVSLDSGVTGTPDSKLPSQDYFDLAGQYRFHDRYTFRIGINNIFDRDPPIIGSGELPSVVGNGNTYPQFYDALGRYVFMGITANF
ncbi:MAG TPA: TonB-dependent receptor [Caulobacteraceae bacterium]|nr:TonB-dependent receptor [Caulobacteraceae bacterium]